MASDGDGGGGGSTFELMEKNLVIILAFGTEIRSEPKRKAAE